MTTNTTASQSHRQKSLIEGSVCSARNLVRRLSHRKSAKALETAESPKRWSTVLPNDNENAEIQYMLSQLSPDELETAARTSYEYLKKQKDSVDDESSRHAYASEMAKRYLRSKKDPKKALEKMKNTIQFRRDIDIDGLRLAFDDPACDYSEQLKENLDSGMVYVQGYDKDGRSTFIFEPRLVEHHDPEWTIKCHVWTLERAIACSKAEDKTVNAVVNFDGFVPSKHAPPTHIGKQFMTTLRDHYAGQVNQIFLVDAPIAFRVLWTIFKPFVGRNTKNKIHFVNSEKQKIQTIGKWYSNDLAKPCMLPDGDKKSELNLDEYLFQTPFDRAFDE